MSEALLTTVARGDRLELEAAGAWTVDCASDLENLVDAAVAQAKTVKSVAINMAKVERLDQPDSQAPARSLLDGAAPPPAPLEPQRR